MPGRRCAVAICGNNFSNARKYGMNISFHAFPRDEALKELWVERCRRKDQFNPKTSAICSIHFPKKEFEVSFQAELTGLPRKKFLKKTAVPSLHLTFDEMETDVPSPRNEELDIIERKKIVEDLLRNSEAAEESEILLHVPPAEESVEMKYEKLLEEHESLKTKYTIVCDSHRNLEKDIKLLKKEATSAVQQQKLEKNVNQSLQQYLSRTFSPAQIQYIYRQNKKVKWSRKDMVNAFTIRCFSRDGYIYLRDTLKYPLPHIDTIKKWASTSKSKIASIAKEVLLDNESI